MPEAAARHLSSARPVLKQALKLKAKMVKIGAVAADRVDEVGLWPAANDWYTKREERMTDATRFGQRTAPGAVSFTCASCHEMAWTVRIVRAGTPVNMGSLGERTWDQDRLTVESSSGTSRIAAPPARVEAVQAVLDGEAPDVLALWKIDEDLAPFYCYTCQLNYCPAEWRIYPLFDDGYYDCTMGTCPAGHEILLDD